MNRLFNCLYILFLPIIATFAQTNEQDYLSISPNSQWRILQESAIFLSSSPFNYRRLDQTATYFFNGDTLLHNQTYWKMYSTTQPTVDVANGDNTYLGAFREKGQKSYFVFANQIEEVLLYDFSIAIGDTLEIEQLNIDYFDSVKVFLASIDTLLTQDSLLRRQFNFKVLYDNNPTPQSFTSWVEGIGNLGIGGFLSTHLDGLELLDYYDTLNGESYGDYFQCFSIGNMVVHQSKKYESCYTYQFRKYIPLVLENATWIQYDAPDGFDAVNYYAYKIQGDTTINKVLYKKLNYYELEKIGSNKFKLLSKRFHLAIREENRIVYAVNAINNGNNNPPDYTESVLIDFNQRKGEVFSNPFLIELSAPIIKDTIAFRFDEYRRILEDANGIELIEGIGYQDGLFLEPHNWTHAGFGFGLVTYCRDINFNCNILTVTNDLLPQKVNIFPNPATKQLNIQFPQSFSGKIQLVSATGQALYFADFKGHTHEVNLANLPRGIYFLYMQSEEGYLVQKVVVQ